MTPGGRILVTTLDRREGKPRVGWCVQGHTAQQLSSWKSGPDPRSVPPLHGRLPKDRDVPRFWVLNPEHRGRQTTGLSDCGMNGYTSQM